jgi:hypothetical protein
MRDLSRAREAARKDLKGKRQQVSSFMLRLGRHYPGKKTWMLLSDFLNEFRLRHQLGHVWRRGQVRKGYQRALRRSLSDDASAPQRMMKGTSATATR